MSSRRFAFILLAACSWANAQLTADPTRPPADFDRVGEVIGAVQSASGDGDLQAVFVRPQGKSTALIGGRTVRLGEQVGERRLTRVGDDFVVLGSGSTREILRLTPAAEKSSPDKKLPRSQELR